MSVRIFVFIAMLFGIPNVLSAADSVLFARDGKAIISGSRDGTVRLWNAETGREVFGFITAGKDRLAWTPEGYYSTSYAGEKLIA